VWATIPSLASKASQHGCGAEINDWFNEEAERDRLKQCVTTDENVDGACPVTPARRFCSVIRPSGSPLGQRLPLSSFISKELFMQRCGGREATVVAERHGLVGLPKSVRQPPEGFAFFPLC